MPTDRELARKLHDSAQTSLRCEKVIAITEPSIIFATQLRTLADALPTLVFLADAEGNCTFSNARLQSYSGLPAEAILRRGWLQLVHVDDLDRADSGWRSSVLLGEPYEVELRLRRHDGTYRRHLCRAEPLRDANGAVLEWLGTCFDFEAHGQAEDARAWLAAIVDTSDDAIVGKTLDGVIRSWNAGAEKLYGYSAAEAIGQSITLIVPAERLTEERTILERLGRGERIHHFETVRIARDGRRLDVSLTISPVTDAEGRVIGASKVARDITERKQAQVAIAASRAELRLVTDHAAVLLAHCDVSERYLFVNRGYAAAMGRLPADLVGRRIADVLDAQAYQEISPHVKRALGGETVSYEFEMTLPDQGLRVLHVTYVPDLDEAGSVQGFVSSISDVTERRALEDRLRESDRRKDEFLAILGHELRNPLAPLSTGIELLQHADERPELVADVRRVVRRQLAHLTRLVDDLVDVARVSRGMIELRRAPVDLHRVVDAAIELAKPLLDDARHELTIRRTGGELSLHGDTERLTQVVANLLSNAAKYTPPGGRIEIVSETAGEDALVRVRDNGLGIPEDQLDGVFELFSQVPEHRAHVNGRGLGIGLALSRQLIELHGGSVHARSAGLRSGSEFVIRLPLSPPAPRSPLPVRKAPAAVAEPRRVLVVDDNIDAAQGLHLVLEMQGHTARVAYDGAEALRVLADFWPEIVLLDIALPELDGYEVARRIRALPGGDTVRLIALTGWGQPEDKQRALDTGFDAHLTKPLDMAALAQALTAEPRAAGSI